MKKSSLNVGLVFILSLLGFTSCQCDLKTGFQDLSSGSQYNLGNSFTSNGLSFTLTQFIWGNGNPSPNGLVEVENQLAGRASAGGSGHNLKVNNVNVQFKLSRTVKAISMDIGYWGGNINLKINGDFKNFGAVSDINNTTVGGVNVSASGSYNNPGKWKFTGKIKSIEIGGQEFFIDNICIKQ